MTKGLSIDVYLRFKWAYTAFSELKDHKGTKQKST